eukprot:maker-scaffold_85-snap-gene-0.44-mRNA-1 protein AED:0.33 eAED:0.41 QI:0/0/0/1/0/0/3/0/166
MGDIYECKTTKHVITPHYPGVYYYKTQKPIKPKLFQSIIGTLSCVSDVCRPDLSFAVNRLAVFGSEPGIEHVRYAKKIVKFTYQTKEYGLRFMKNKKKIDLTLYTDASWKTSIDGYLLLANGTPISWKSKRQKTISKSSTEAETIGLGGQSRDTEITKWSDVVRKE